MRLIFVEKNNTLYKGIDFILGEFPTNCFFASIIQYFHRQNKVRQ